MCAHTCIHAAQFRVYNSIPWQCCLYLKQWKGTESYSAKVWDEQKTTKTGPRGSVNKKYLFQNNLSSRKHHDIVKLEHAHFTQCPCSSTGSVGHGFESSPWPFAASISSILLPTFLSVSHCSPVKKRSKL